MYTRLTLFVDEIIGHIAHHSSGESTTVGVTGHTIESPLLTVDTTHTYRDIGGRLLQLPVARTVGVTRV